MNTNLKEQIKTLIPKDKFLKCNRWEQRFISSVMHLDQLTDRQMSTVKEISRKYQVKKTSQEKIKELADNLYD